MDLGDLMCVGTAFYTAYAGASACLDGGVPTNGDPGLRRQ